MEFLYNLKSEYSSQKSFYNKAKVFRDNRGNLYLKSYSTIVAKMEDGMVTNDGKPHMHIFGWYSKTTANHINEFLQQNGFDALNKKQMLEIKEEADA